MGIFKATKSDLTAGPDIPVNQVIAMRQQGYSNSQIIQTLQRDGYASSQIFDAISQSEMNTQPTMDMQQQVQMPQQMPQMPQQPQSAPMNALQGTPEELIEAIIDEKWNELVKDINKVIDWKQKADSKLTVMEQQVNDLQQQFDKLHQALIGKIGDYDKNMLEVSSELAAMDKAFSKILPSFIDNVNELGTITQNLKAQKKPANPVPVKTSSKRKLEELE